MSDTSETDAKVQFLIVSLKEVSSLAQTFKEQRDEARHDFKEQSEVVQNLKVALEEVSKLARTLKEERDEARDQRNRLHELHNQNAIHYNELLELCVTLRKERDDAQNASEAFSALAWKLEGERNEARDLADKYLAILKKHNLDQHGN